MLTLVVLRETVEEEDGFGFKDEVQYRVLSIEEGKFVCRVYRKPSGSSVFEISSGIYLRVLVTVCGMKFHLHLLVHRIMITLLMKPHF
ncbi:hypothetical protein ACVXG7_03550 [Enterobacter hormaechei]